MASGPSARVWANAEKRWLAECLSRARLGRPSDNYHIGKVTDHVSIRREFLTGGFGPRSMAAVENQLRTTRLLVNDLVDDHVEDIPQDVKDAKDSGLLIDWVLKNQDPYVDDLSQSEEEGGEGGEDGERALENEEGLANEKDGGHDENKEEDHDDAVDKDDTQEETAEKKEDTPTNEDTVDQPSPQPGQDAHDHDHDSVGGSSSSSSASPSEFQRLKRDFKHFKQSMDKFMEEHGQALGEEEEEDGGDEEEESRSPGSTTTTLSSPKGNEGSDTTTTTKDPLSPSPAGKKGTATPPNTKRKKDTTTGSEVGMDAAGEEEPSSPKDEDVQTGDTVAA